MPLAGLWYIEPVIHRDFRGFYTELSILPDISAMVGSVFEAKQMNLAHSETHVARGFHAEQWDKIVTVVTGEAFCAWVDLREHSPTFGDSVSMLLGSTPEAQLGSVYISRGFGNGYVVTQGPMDYVYVTNALYRERELHNDRAIALLDPELGIPWPMTGLDMMMSQRDKQAISLNELKTSLQL